MSRGLLRAAVVLALVVSALVARPASAQLDQQRLVNNAVATVERLSADPDFVARVKPLLNRAKAVLIVPHLVKAGFILGGEYGMGVLLAKRPDGQWSYPAFYTLGAGSFGLQAGVQDAEVLFAIMSDKALSAIMNNAVKFGADLGIAILGLGGGTETSTTTNLSVDVYAYSRAVGLFGGGSLEGAIIKPRSTWNSAYYGNGTSPEAILLGGAAANEKAEALRSLLGR